MFPRHLTIYLWDPIYHAARIIYDAAPITTASLPEQGSQADDILMS